MKEERVERHTIHRQPPLGGSHDFHAGYGAAAGRSSDLQALPVKTDRSFYWPIFPVLEKTSGIWVFDPAYRCGAVPDLHRVPFRRSPWERHQQTSHKIEGC